MKNIKNVVLAVVGIAMVWVLANSALWAWDAEHVMAVDAGKAKACAFKCVCNGGYEMGTRMDAVLGRHGQEVK